LMLKTDPAALSAMGARARHEALTRQPELMAWISALAQAAPISSAPVARSLKDC
jgi:hypothetical protein